MNAITDFRTVYIPAVLPPKVAKPAPVCFTMEQLQADARAAQERQKRMWHQAVETKTKRTPSIRMVVWTPERIAAMEAEILKILRRDGPLTNSEISGRLRAAHNRHKLRDVLTAMKKAGSVTSRQTSNVRHEWQVAV